MAGIALRDFRIPRVSMVSFIGWGEAPGYASVYPAAVGKVSPARQHGSGLIQRQVMKWFMGIERTCILSLSLHCAFSSFWYMRTICRIDFKFHLVR